MDQTQVTVTFAEDHKLVAIKLPSIQLNFTANDLAAFIESLGNVRSQMIPAVPEQLPETDAYDTLQNPSYLCESDPLRSGSLLHLGESRYGWLHFLIPRDEARKLGEALLAHAEGGDLESASSKAH